MTQLSHLQIRNPKEDETSVEAATQIFSSLLSSQVGFFTRLFGEVDNYAFELYLTGQTIYYYATSLLHAKNSFIVSSSHRIHSQISNANLTLWISCLKMKL